VGSNLRSTSAERPEQGRAPSKIICAGEIRQRNEDRADTKICKLQIPPHMINCRRRVVPGGVNRGRRSSPQSLHTCCDILAVGTDHRQVENSYLHACRITTHRDAMLVQNVDLGL
jgi:hypothetical protein